jgi:hypothetical protein
MRKKWTAREDITASLLKFREKRKWQLALRRYVIESNVSYAYAPYFGLSIADFRLWIEIQFNKDLKWENFGKAWQFEHLVPVAYFDFSKEEDLRLCWNFINIGVERLDLTKNTAGGLDVLAVRPYFEKLYNKTGYPLCKRMLERIAAIEQKEVAGIEALGSFINQRNTDLSSLSTLNPDEFSRLNTGTSLKELLIEREIIKKFG